MESCLNPHTLLSGLAHVDQDLGRRRTAPWESVPIKLLAAWAARAREGAYFFKWMTNTTFLSKWVGTHTCSQDSYVAHTHTHTHPLWLHPLSWQEGTTMWGSTRQTYPVSSAPFVVGSGTRGHRSSGAALPGDDHVPLPAHVSLLTTSTHTSGLLPTPCRCEAFFAIKMMLWKSASCLVRDQPALLQKVQTPQLPVPGAATHSTATSRWQHPRDLPQSSWKARLSQKTSKSNSCQASRWARYSLHMRPYSSHTRSSFPLDRWENRGSEWLGQQTILGHGSRQCAVSQATGEGPRSNLGPLGCALPATPTDKGSVHVGCACMSYWWVSRRSWEEVAQLEPQTFVCRMLASSCTNNFWFIRK